MHHLNALAAHRSTSETSSYTLRDVVDRAMEEVRPLDRERIWVAVDDGAARPRVDAARASRGLSLLLQRACEAPTAQLLLRAGETDGGVHFTVTTAASGGASAPSDEAPSRWTALLQQARGLGARLSLSHPSPGFTRVCLQVEGAQ